MFTDEDTLKELIAKCKLKLAAYKAQLAALRKRKAQIKSEKLTKKGARR